MEYNDAKTVRRYMRLAEMAGKHARCLKKRIGCVLLLANGMAIGGSNGPPKPLQNCKPSCPRASMESGTHLELCRAVHSERQVLLKAARAGFKTEGSILYCSGGVPCKDCLLEIFQAGVKHIIVQKPTYYDGLSQSVLADWIKEGGKFEVL